MNKINNIMKQFAVILMLFLSISMVAQVTKSTGTRITDNMTEKALSKTAILDLDSSNKGFFMPRMNEAQRADLEKAIIEEGKKNTGLVIYNTDNDCIEYWHSETNKWRSLCGSLPPAEIVVDGTCENIVLNGFNHGGATDYTWQQGKPLDTTHTMIVPIKVNKVGTYTASAITDNGYFFSGEGQFQAVGNYFVTLKGAGTPIRGYDQNGTKKGDLVTINFNGVDSKECKNLEIKIVPADLKLTIKTDTYKAEGEYYVNESAAGIPSNKLSIKITVTSPGTATIIAYNRELGIKFSGTKKVENGVDQDFELLPVVGEAAPKLNDKASYDLVFGVNVVNESEVIAGKVATIVIEPTTISFKDTDIVYSKEPLYRGTALNDKHSITIPVSVDASGTTTLRLKDSTGKIEFVAKDVVLNKVKDGTKQNVVFIPTIKADAVTPDADSMTLTLSGDATRFKVTDNKPIVVPLNIKPVAYTIDCANIKPNRTAIPYNVPIKELYYIIVPVNVTVIGEYEINTVGSADGIKFSSTRNGVKQVFPKIGAYDVKLYAVDDDVIPTHKGNYSLEIVTNDGSGKNTCSNKFIAKVGFSDIKILYYHGDEFSKGSFFNAFINGNDPTKGEKRFGPKGVIVETGEVSISTFKVTRSSQTETQTNTPASRAALAKKINDGEFNLIVLEGPAILKSLDQQLYDAFLNYVKNDKAFYILTSAKAGEVGFKTYKETLLKQYSDYYSESDKLKYVGDVNLTVGLDFLDALNGDKSVLITPGSDGNSHVLHFEDMDVLKKWNGDKRFYSPYLTTGKSASLYNVTGAIAITSVGSEYETIVSSTRYTPTESASILLNHKKYGKFFWLVGSREGTVSSVFNSTTFTANGEPMSDSRNTIGPLMSNIFVHLISTIANE
ncbi:hypothetical protein [Myroides marinus]|nr:hypothetical protein [Myroides marinus]